MKVRDARYYTARIVRTRRSPRVIQSEAQRSEESLYFDANEKAKCWMLRCAQHDKFAKLESLRTFCIA